MSYGPDCYCGLRKFSPCFEICCFRIEIDNKTIDNKMKKTVIIALFSIVLVQTGSKTLFGQKNREFSLTAINESIAFPFSSYSEFHPGFELGVSVLSSEKDHSIRQLNTYAGWFLHQHIESGFYFRGEYSYKLKLGKGLRAGIYGGAGYLHTFYPGT